jgi:hypothetical protein
MPVISPFIVIAKPPSPTAATTGRSGFQRGQGPLQTLDANLIETRFTDVQTVAGFENPAGSRHGFQ